MQEKSKAKTVTTKKRKSDNRVIPRYGRRCLGKGVYVSNDTRVTHLNNNDLIIGSSGSCKTGSIVYTQLKTLQDSSLIVADSKNMLHRMFRDELEKKGYKVRVLDFVNPEQSCMYNPLDYIRKYEDDSYNEMDIMKISRSFIPEQMDGKDPFWAANARAVLEFFISYTLSALPAEDHNMYTVARLYRAFSREMGEAAFIDWIERHPGTFTANRYTQIKAMQVADKTWSGILAFVNIALYPFDVAILHHIFDPNGYEDHEDVYGPYFDEDLFDDLDFEDFDCDDADLFADAEEESGDVTSGGSGADHCAGPMETSVSNLNEDSVEESALPEKEELKIAALGEEKTVLFLNISDTDHSMDSLVNLFYTQALQTLVSEADKHENGQLTVPCRIIFDDFAAGTVIPDFDKEISVIRSRDIWVTLSVQSLSQLESLYSHAQSLTIQNNCDHIVYMGSNDLNSAEYIGTRAGKVPEEILAMDRTREYFIEGGKKAILIDKVPPYSYSEGLQAE
ncbi:MAG: type IV secretory system conjugative DNA transfer family protein [Lachnospiraceae bacterium]|nr:type IV secretory system conjugative DNA transfer family protein [Lachnospiraceae bacterium]